MKKWTTALLLLFIILFAGHGTSLAHSGQSAAWGVNAEIHVKSNSVNEHYFQRNHSFETFKRKACLTDTEETEENFSAVQKQLVKNTYFLHFLGRNNTGQTLAFGKKIYYRSIFILLSAKTYVLFQVFRI